MHDNIKVQTLRVIKRGGKEHSAGTVLEIPRHEFEAAPPGLYVIPGSQKDPVEVAKQEKASQAEQDRADKLRRLEAERRRKEDEAARQVALIEEQKRLAESSHASARKRRQALS